MSHTDFVVENTSQALPVWQFLQPHRSIVLCKEGKLLVSVHLVTDVPTVAAKMERFQLFAKNATEFGIWVCNHTDDFIAMILAEEGSEEPINYYNCVRPHSQRLIESDNRHDNRRLMIKAQAENKTVAEVKAEAAATGKAADVTELVLAVTPTTQDFKGAVWSMAPLAIRGEAKPVGRIAKGLLGNLVPMGANSFGNDTSQGSAFGSIGFGRRSQGVAFGSSTIGSSSFGSSAFGSANSFGPSFGSASPSWGNANPSIGSSFGSANPSFGASASSSNGPEIILESAPDEPVLESAVVPNEPPLSTNRPVESSDKKPKLELPGETAVAGKIGVSDEKVEVNGVEIRIRVNADQTVAFNLLLSLWDKLEVTLPTAADLESALKEAGSVAGAITKVYESAEDVILGESKPDCVFFSCGHKITTMELAASITKCPLCRAPIYARIPASEIRNAVIQQI